MWRLKSWLSDLGVWLWLRFGGEKTYIAFRHTGCNSEVVQLADFRKLGPEFQCFQCNALVPLGEIAFRIVSTEEVKKIKAEATKKEDDSEQSTYEYFESGVLPHIVV